MEYEPCLQKRKRPTSRPPGPDGCEAWFVAFAACVINFIMAGLARMSGILYVAFLDIFNTDRKQASLPFSVRSSTRNLLGPVVGILGQKYGVRPVTIVGGILGTLGAASCFYANDILWLAILWGGFNGIGTALCTTLPQVIIGQHFKEYRSTAAGMSFSGGCIGAFLFPIILEYLLYTYNLGGTFLIIAGFIMHVIPAAMILKTPSWLNKKAPTIVVTAVSEENVTVGNSEEMRIQNNGKENNGKENNRTENNGTENNGKENIENVNDIANNSEKNGLGFSSIKYSTKIDVTCNSPGSTNKTLLNGKTIDTHLLWLNRTLVIRLLTDDFTLKSPDDIGEINQSKSLTNSAVMKEIEDVFCKIVKDMTCDKHMRKCSMSDTAAKTDGKSEEKCSQLRNDAHLNESLHRKLSDFPIINSTPLDSLSFYLEFLFERDRDILFQSFPESEHEQLTRVLEELWNVHAILSNNNTNVYLCSHSTTSLFLDGESVNFDDNAEHPNTFCSHIKTAFVLHTKPLFILICLCRSAHFLTFVPIVTTIVDFSMDKGLPAEDGKYLIAALSFGDLMGRLCLGWITDKGYVSLPRYMLFVMIIQGASTATLSFMDSRASLLTAIAVFGLLQGSIFVRHPVLVSRYLGSHEQSIAMGCINFFSGILAFALPNYIGYFRDTIGSYNGMLYINGTVGAAIGFLWIFEPYFLKLSIARARHNQRVQV